MRYGKQDYEIIGYLEDGLNNIKFDKNEYMYIWLTPLSDFPNSITDDIDKIQIYATELRKFDFADDGLYQDRAERAERLAEFLSDSLLICTPEIIRNDENGQTFCRGSNVTLVAKNEGFTDSYVKFLSLPVFDKDSFKSSINSKDSFKWHFYNEKLVGRLFQYSKDADDYPQYVLWKEDEDNHTLFGEITGQNYSTYGVQYSVNKKSKHYIELSSPEDDDWFDSEHLQENVVFIPADILEKKMGEIERLIQISDEEISLTKEEFLRRIDNGDWKKMSATSELEGLTTFSNNSFLGKQESNDKAIISDRITDNNDPKSGSSDNEKSEELQFIDRFEFVAEKQFHLHYDKKDLINFHAAMKGDSLVILAGLSGTGKTQLIHTYAKALNIGESQLRFISVRPFWEDDSDLLGYADTVNSVYRPGDSGLLDILIDASKSPDNLYMICFDEMNLARVEHYFSQFLSVLELSPENRRLKLYNSELEKRLYNSAYYPPEIIIGPNVLFVGTINTDESTHQFSDKVLDRSNIISLKVVPFNNVLNLDQIDDTNKPKNVRAIKYDKYKSFKKSNINNALKKAEKDMLWEIHLEMNSHDKNVGIGWRILKQIDDYLQNIPEESELTRNEAIDYQLVQRILTKIRGSEEQLADMLGVWNKASNSYEIGSLEKILDKNTGSSSFEFSRHAIHQKAKELSLHGFTI